LLNLVLHDQPHIETQEKPFGVVPPEQRRPKNL
jgi:hypothetical protein